MKNIKTVDAVGHVICHDITRIIKDVVKDVAFCKGHIVTPEDIPVLLSLGKDHLYVWEKDEHMLHENEAAEILSGMCKDEYMSETPVKEGKIELISKTDGLFSIDTNRLEAINALGEIAIVSRHTNYPVQKGDRLIGMRVIPLIIEKEKMDKAKALAGDKSLACILPYKAMKVGIVTTGNEVFFGRIKDTFTDVIKQKLQVYGGEVTGHITVPDDKEKITEAIWTLKNRGAEMIICTGGMSVDPDDLTPGAIKDTGAEMITYGAPVLPGAMFLLGYFEDGTPVMGLPGCVMYTRTTVFDLILPRIVAGIKVTKKDIARMGHGGLCLNCNPCEYPNCSFGK